MPAAICGAVDAVLADVASFADGTAVPSSRREIFGTGAELIPLFNSGAMVSRRAAEADRPAHYQHLPRECGDLQRHRPAFRLRVGVVNVITARRARPQPSQAFIDGRIYEALKSLCGLHRVIKFTI